MKRFTVNQYSLKNNRFTFKKLGETLGKSKASALYEYRKRNKSAHIWVEEQKEPSFKNVYFMSLYLDDAYAEHPQVVKVRLGRIDGLDRPYESINKAIDSIKSKSIVKIYVELLRFDGQFIMGAYTSHKTVTNKVGEYFSINFTNENGTRIEVKDLSKKLPFTAEELKEAFDYDIEDSHVIFKRALFEQFSLGNTHSTYSSDSFSEWKESIGGARIYDKLFPELELSQFLYLKEAYSGGWCYCGSTFKTCEGLALDKNSAYPSAMVEELLPYGEPIYFEGNYDKQNYEFKHYFPLYVQRIRVDAVLKENHFPSIMQRGKFSSQQSLFEKSGFYLTELYLTNIDFELLKRDYTIRYIEYVDGYAFQGARGFFDSYINKHYAIKKNATGAVRLYSKLKLNSLYGSFGISKIRIDFDGNMSIERGRRIDMALFITSYVRRSVINMAFLLKDRFLYSDTDSVHIKGWDVDEILPYISNDELGKWKIEKVFTKGIYRSNKCYAEFDKEWEVKCSGLDKESAMDFAKWQNFEEKFGGVEPVSLTTKRSVKINGGARYERMQYTL